MFAIAPLLLTVLLSGPVETPSESPALKQQVRTLLDDYARKDVSAILAMLDDGPVLFMGTAVSEVAPSRESIAHLLDDDFKLWDSSRFGAYKDFFVRRAGDMATAFFDVPWEATTKGQTRSFDIRLATVWHRTADGWKLAQMLDAVASP